MCDTKVCQCSESSLTTDNEHLTLSIRSVGNGGAGGNRRLPKPPKTPPKSNAEKCREYKERLKKDPERYQQMVERNRLLCKALLIKEIIIYCAFLLRNQLKEEETKKAPTPQASSTPASTPTRAARRKLEKQLAEKREKARLRQAKRRAAIKANPQRYRREKEKRRVKYIASRESLFCEESSPATSKRQFSLAKVLSGLKQTFQKSRTKLSLMRLDLVKKNLGSQNHHTNKLFILPTTSQ
ncbi:hypothetical protein PoB_000982800 [Plakobranchus ocellatus]|uniref:Uncharacterized protein n=1 Tax=Plakobranchus ocellatus TaxID=259542 RepID=A0AAV3YLU6_9GAST|nr:hypothetical protein PoB_000982800 [Plakobranchus ocellatus]